MTKRIAFLTMMLLASCALVAQSASSVPAQEQSRAPQSQPAPAATQAAQSTPAAQEQSADVSPESADLAITAHVTARELRFETVPNPQVKFTGGPRLKTQWDAVREHLPRPVEPGVTYRDIGIRLKIVSVFADIDRIVAEALGEVPVQDELPPVKSPPKNNSPESKAPAIDAPLNNSGQNISPAQGQPPPVPAPVSGPLNKRTGAQPL